jgi:cytochrome c-type biogenesis protein CcmH
VQTESAVAASAGLLAFRKSVDTSSLGAAAPADAQVLIARAEEHRHKRGFAAACSAYEKVVASGAMTADAWADYADALGSRDGTLAPAAKAIDQSLKLDPRHPKALWLKASLEHEQNNYAASLETWKQLLAVLPPDSSDSRVVKANVAETMQLIETNGRRVAKGQGG